MRYADCVDELLATPGVLAALVVSREDGIVVDGNGHVGVDTDAVAALAASLYARAAAAAEASDGGAPGFLHLEGELGRLCAVPRGDLLLVTVAEPFANLGLLRLAMRRLAERLTP
ncbi:MAG: roadblock/LC7 domain-containing protein [Gemmatimonadaceae bacterium]|jgi:predicted regulator of Ras-like GTPase activity (Roadblock/LC7/MglB family)|nr:roadblock/LC7 domain-containing protein [Gemmatimonadaceae bacterium]